MKASKSLENYLNIFKNPDLGKSVSTYNNYSRDLGKFFDYFKFDEITDVEKVTKDDYREFIFSMTTLSNNSKNGVMRVVNAFMNHLTSEDIITKESITDTRFGGKKYLPVKREYNSPLSNDEITLIYSVCKSAQEKFMIAFLIYTGLRESSVVNVKIADIDEYGFFRVKAKGDKLVPVKMSPHLLQLFQAYKANRKTDMEYLFYPTSGTSNAKLLPTAVNGRVKSILERTNLSKERKSQITAHKFRHAFVTRIYQNNSPEHAKQAAHHSNSATTEIYNDDKYSLGLRAMQELKFELGDKEVLSTKKFCEYTGSKLDDCNCGKCK